MSGGPGHELAAAGDRVDGVRVGPCQIALTGLASLEGRTLGSEWGWSATRFGGSLRKPRRNPTPKSFRQYKLDPGYLPKFDEPGSLRRRMAHQKGRSTPPAGFLYGAPSVKGM